MALIGAGGAERLQAVAVDNARLMVGGTYDAGFEVLDASIATPAAESIFRLDLFR